MGSLIEEAQPRGGKEEREAHDCLCTGGDLFGRQREFSPSLFLLNSM